MGGPDFDKEAAFADADRIVAAGRMLPVSYTSTEAMRHILCWKAAYIEPGTLEALAVESELRQIPVIAQSEEMARLAQIQANYKGDALPENHPARRLVLDL